LGRFANPDQVYATIGQTFVAMVRSGGVGARFGELDSSLLLDLDGPSAPLTLVLRPGGASTVEFTKTGAATIGVAMGADLAHELLLGELNPYAAVSAGQIRLSGDLAPLLGLLPAILFATPPIYRAVLADQDVLFDSAGMG
jgi:hypothetical protein